MSLIYNTRIWRSELSCPVLCIDVTNSIIENTGYYCKYKEYDFNVKFCMLSQMHNLSEGKKVA